MKRRQIAQLLCLLLALLIVPQTGQSAEQSPAQFLKDFYAWYITTDKGSIRAIHDAAIYQYVARETVEQVKSISYELGTDRRDYFLKSGNPPLSMEGVTIYVGQVTNMGVGTYVAPVTIVSSLSDKHTREDTVVVILKKIDGMLKIVRCVDIYPEA